VSDYVNIMRSVVRDLETVQGNIGQLQIQLLDILTDENQDEWDEVAQAALLKLELVQRNIGDVQVILVEHLPGNAPAAHQTIIATDTTVIEEDNETAIITTVAEVIIEDQKFSPPQDWLEKRGIKIKSLPASSGIDHIADRAALFLGDNFSVLQSFYEAVKRAVNRGYDESWFSLEDTPASTIAKVCELCTILHGSGFLIRFRNLKRNPKHNPNQKAGIVFSPLKDPGVNRFFTGGWLERYVVQVTERAAEAAFGRESKMPILREVQIELPTGCDRELDLLAGLPNDRVVWLECKTGDFRPFIPALQDLNKRFLKLSLDTAAVVIVEQLDDEQKASASALTGMSVLHLSELNDWLSRLMR
jgi:hypothetical protein